MDEILPNYMGIITSHFLRIPELNNQHNGKYIRGFFSWLTCHSFQMTPSSTLTRQIKITMINEFNGIIHLQIGCVSIVMFSFWGYR